MRRFIGTAVLLALGAFACGSENADGTPLDRRRPAAATNQDDVTGDDDEGEGKDLEPEPTPAPVLCDEQDASYEPKRPKSNILFAVDRSGSMQIKLPTGGTRWAATRTALFKMLDALPKMNVRAGVMQFPQGDPTVNSCCKIDANNAVSCNCSSYPAPAKRCDAATYTAEGPKELDADSIQAMKQSINASNTAFYWGTPLAAAEGAAVRIQKASKNDGIKSIVLLTDGAPTSCDTTANPNANDVQLVVDAATSGMRGDQKIRTYVIGVVDGANGNDARPDVVSKIAEAGGTGKFFSVSAAQLEKDLGDALEKIAREATDCTFDLPAATAQTDTEKVNVTVGSAAVPRDMTQKDGWDFVADKKQIKLFGGACASAQADGKVHVVLGCKTVGRP
jgi:hypothetical protein